MTPRRVRYGDIPHRRWVAPHCPSCDMTSGGRVAFRHARTARWYTFGPTRLPWLHVWMVSHFSAGERTQLNPTWIITDTEDGSWEQRNGIDRIAWCPDPWHRTSDPDGVDHAGWPTQTLERQAEVAQRVARRHERARAAAGKDRR